MKEDMFYLFIVFQKSISPEPSVSSAMDRTALPVFTFTLLTHVPLKPRNSSQLPKYSSRNLVNVVQGRA
jgi:hypothetical protein